MGAVKKICCHCSEKGIGSDTGMKEHLEKHIAEELMTVPQLRALRKQLSLYKSAGGSSKKSSTSRHHNCQSTSKESGSSAGHDQQESDTGGDSEGTQDQSSDVEPQQDEREIRVDEREVRVPDFHQERTSNFDDTLVRFKLRPADEERQDLMLFLANRKRQLSDNIKGEIRRMSAVKWYACVTVKMTKYSPEGDIRDTAKPTFRSVSQTALNFDDISKQMDAAIFKICDNLEKFSREGSGWRLDDVLLLEQTILKYNPLRGSCSDYVLPEQLKRKSCLLSVFGTPSNGMECFKYACLLDCIYQRR